MEEADKTASMLEHVPADTLQAPTSFEKEDEKQEKSKSRWGRSKKKSEDMDDELTEAELYQSPRPAFFANARSSKRSQIPHDVSIPYFRFRKDRFYDWPPDPTVSRATPLEAVVERDESFGVQQNWIQQNWNDFVETDNFESSIRSRSSNRQKGNQRKHSHDDANFGYGY